MNMNELNVCKEQLRACITESSLNIDADDIVNILTEPINLTKFTAWFASAQNIIKTKTNQHSYFKKAFISELSRGRFKQEQIAVETITLATALRNKGIIVSGDDTAYLQVMWQHILGAGLPADTATELNHKAIDYLKKGQSFSDYVNLFKNGKALLPYKIDWNRIQSEYQSILKEWDKILDELYEGDFHGKDD